MKGIFIHNNLEFRLEVQGDEYCQGDRLDCSLSVKNHGETPVSSPALRLELGVVDLKKLKEKQDDAFEVREAAELPALGEIGGKQTSSTHWIFTLHKNFPISDKAQSPAFYFGDRGNVAATQILPFNLLPHRIIQKIAATLESPFQFVCKGHKASSDSVSGDWVEVKLKPPNAKRLALLDELGMCFQFDGEDIKLKYKFRVKNFDVSGSQASVKKVKTVVEQRLDPKSYLLTDTHINNEIIDAKIEEALSTVSTTL